MKELFVFGIVFKKRNDLFIILNFVVRYVNFQIKMKLFEIFCIECGTSLLQTIKFSEIYCKDCEKRIGFINLNPDEKLEY